MGERDRDREIKKLLALSCFLFFSFYSSFSKCKTFFILFYYLHPTTTTTFFIILRSWPFFFSEVSPPVLVDDSIFMCFFLLFYLLVVLKNLYHFTNCLKIIQVTCFSQKLHPVGCKEKFFWNSLLKTRTYQEW